jgi:putative heme-binding domain-containing protein
MIMRSLPVVFMAFGCTLAAGAAQAQVIGVGPIPQWLWSDPFPRASQTVWLRKAFTLDRVPREATLRGLADDRMTVFINGRSAATVADARTMRSVEVARFLREGVNLLAIEAYNERGPAGVLVDLHWIDADGNAARITTDPSWRVAADRNHFGTGASDGSAAPAHSFGLAGVLPWGNPEGQIDDYFQWKKALGSGTGTEPAIVAVASGFRLTRVRSAQPGEGSWISLAFDQRGRLYLGREGKGLLRTTLPAPGADPAPSEVINDSLEECRGLLFAHGALYANANNSKALYRLRDADGDDRFDEVKLLFKTEGGVGHGRNGLALGPDQMIYTMHGNNVLLPAGFSPGASPLQHLAEDRFRPCAWDRFLFDPGTRVPAGHVGRIDAAGTSWQLFAGGFRNAYGIDFSADAELFTYDADNEGDLGTSWYRPTRLNHVVSGADYGFRQGTGNRRAHYAEHPPSNLEIGLGSPTGVRFGTGTNFPRRYQRACFILDWAYGRVYAVHLLPRGAGYACNAEKIVEGTPLNVTDLAVGPDGAMYLVTGGRGTQSALYRLSWAGPRDMDPAPAEDELREQQHAEQARRERRALEAFHGRADPRAVDLAWPRLGSEDPWLRHAARVALESQPAASWQDRALSEADLHTALTALLALARVADGGVQRRLIERVNALPWNAKQVDRCLAALRIYEVSFARMGRPEGAVMQLARDRLEPLFPAEVSALNERLCELLAYLESAALPAKALPLVESAATQEEKFALLFALRDVRFGWNDELRRRYFLALRAAEQFTGDRYVIVGLNAIRDEALARLSEEERAALAPLFAQMDAEAAAARDELAARPFVRKWVLVDLTGDLSRIDKGRSFQRGQELFRQALCDRCHRLNGAGAAYGPDLSAVGHRFGRRDLLEQILDPSKVVDEKFRLVQFETRSGKTLTGRVVGGDEKSLLIGTDPFAPRATVRVKLEEIESQSESTISAMPAGLIDSFSKEEILDLLAYLQAGGNPRHPNFAPEEK